MAIKLDTGTIIASITTLLLSSIISYFIYRRQKSIEFDYDYRKYILEKRKETYEKIEQLIAHFQQYNFKRFLNDGDSKDIIDAINLKLNYLATNDIWVNDTTQVALWTLRAFITEAKRLNHLAIVTPATENLFKQEYYNTRAILVNAYFDDITTLNKIDAFKHRKIKNYNRIHKNSIEEVYQANLRKVKEDGD